MQATATLRPRTLFRISTTHIYEPEAWELTVSLEVRELLAEESVQLLTPREQLPDPPPLLLVQLGGERRRLGLEMMREPPAL